MTDSNKGQSKEIVHLSLATSRDELAINAFLGSQHDAMPTDAPRIFSATDDIARNRFTLKACLPSGEVVATVCLGLAQTQDELSEQLGPMVPWVGDFPILALAQVAPLVSNPYTLLLRLVSLIVADLMSVDGNPVAALLNTRAGARALARYSSSVFASSSGGVLKAHFSDAIGALLESVTSNWEWVGMLPFASHLPAGMDHLGLTVFANRTYA